MSRTRLWLLVGAVALGLKVLREHPPEVHVTVRRVGPAPVWREARAAARPAAPAAAPTAAAAPEDTAPPARALSAKERAQAAAAQAGTAVGDKLLSSPEAQRELARRPPHRGPWLALRWPRESGTAARVATHVALHQRQFVEDGSLASARQRLDRRDEAAGEDDAGGEEGASSRPRVRPHVDYPATGPNGTAVLARYLFHPGVPPRLPEEDVAWHWDTCAVVSNSGELLAKEAGEAIDGHDAVIRINLPPVAGYERHVGSRTTLDLCNHHHARRVGYSKPRQWRFVPAGSTGRCGNRWACDKRKGKAKPAAAGESSEGAAQAPEPSTLVLFESASNAGWRFLVLRDVLQRYGKESVTILSPDLAVAAEEAWNALSAELLLRAGGGGGNECREAARRRSAQAAGMSKRRTGPQSASARLGAEGAACKPTSGWFAVAVALQVCGRVSLYGFSRWTPGQASAPYHYFDKVEGTADVHSFDLNRDALEALRDAGYPITLAD